MSGAFILLIQGPFGKNNREYEPGASLIGYSLLANIWFIVSFIFVVRGRVSNLGDKITFYFTGAIATCFALQPLIWFSIWKMLDQLLVAYYFWLCSIILLLLIPILPAVQIRNPKDLNIA